MKALIEYAPDHVELKNVPSREFVELHAKLHRAAILGIWEPTAVPWELVAAELKRARRTKHIRNGWHLD